MMVQAIKPVTVKLRKEEVGPMRHTADETADNVSRGN
jgi:hypothetical protein